MKLFSKVSMMDLFGMAGIIGLCGAGVSIVLVNRTRDRVFKEDYCIKAFKVLEQNTSAMSMIGSPLKKYRIDFSDQNNNCFESLSTRLKVPFKGTKRSGDLFVWAERQTNQSDWTLKRLEIIFDDIKDKKVIVFKNENNE